MDASTSERHPDFYPAPEPPEPVKPVVVQAYGASYSFIRNNLLEELLEEEKARARASGLANADPIEALLARVNLPNTEKATAEESASLLREAIEAAPAEALGLEDVVMLKEALARVEAQLAEIRKAGRRRYVAAVTRRPATLREKVAAIAVVAALVRWLP